jgi:outer membrane protein assembly factor BamB
VNALDIQTGKVKWTYTAGGPVDSPPTLYAGLCLFGGSDGWVYCVRMKDGALVWRVRAAPQERRIIGFGSLESAWPVHGSVLVKDGVACFAAGRHSGIDGGIKIYGAEPCTGKIMWQKTVKDPDIKVPENRQSFKKGNELQSQLNDILISFGDFGYMFSRSVQFSFKDGKSNPKVRQSRFRFGKIGMLDDNMKTWWSPGYGKPRGQIIAFDPKRVFGAIAFGKKKGKYDTYTYPAQGNFKLFGNFGKKEPGWTFEKSPAAVNSIVVAGEHMFAAGPPDTLTREGGMLLVLSAKDGKKLNEIKLDHTPVFDSMSAAQGKLFMATMDGKLLCFGK